MASVLPSPPSAKPTSANSHLVATYPGLLDAGMVTGLARMVVGGRVTVDVAYGPSQFAASKAPPVLDPVS